MLTVTVATNRRETKIDLLSRDCKQEQTHRHRHRHRYMHRYRHRYRHRHRHGHRHRHMRFKKL